MGFPIYHLELKIERCRARARLNDVPVADITAAGASPEWFAPPVNPYLVGRGNQLVVEVFPLPEAEGDPAALRGAVVDGAVRVYGKGDAVAPGEGPVVLDLPVTGALAERFEAAAERDEEVEIPQAFRYEFDNEGPSSAAELTEGEDVGDAEALRDYAMLLRDRARAGDMAGLAAEMEPKVMAYAAAYDDDPGAIRRSLQEVLQNEYAPRGFETELEREDVELLPCAGGRLCELARPGGRPLLQTPPDADGSTMQIAVVVGKRDGALRIVR